MAALYTGGKRNIIVLGRTGSGKSTLANNIICQDGAFNQNVTGQITNVVENVRIEGQVYAINIIDTVGLGRGGKSDNEIMKDIKKHIKRRAPEGLNLIIFVLQNGEFTDEEHNVFRKITKNFKDIISSLSLLVITGCDGKSQKERNDIILKFKTDPVSKQFADIMEKGIHCVGLSEEVKRTAIQDINNDMIPIHKIIAEARLFYLQDEIQRDTSWCIIL